MFFLPFLNYLLFSSLLTKACSCIKCTVIFQAKEHARSETAKVKKKGERENGWKCALGKHLSDQLIQQKHFIHIFLHPKE